MTNYPFRLPCTVRRNKNSSFTGLGMSYFSNCSFKFKLNCIQTLYFILSRAYRIIWHSIINFVFLRANFRSNGFCTSFIDRRINQFLYKVFGCPKGVTKEDIGIEQQLYEIVRGKNFALNCLS